MLHLVGQTIGYGIVPTIPPEGTVVAFGGLVMKDEKIANRFVFSADCLIILVRQQRIHVITGPQVEQLDEPGMNQMDAG